MISPDGDVPTSTRIDANASSSGEDEEVLRDPGPFLSEVTLSGLTKAADLRLTCFLLAERLRDAGFFSWLVFISRTVVGSSAL